MLELNSQPAVCLGKLSGERPPAPEAALRGLEIQLPPYPRNQTQFGNRGMSEICANTVPRALLDQPIGTKRSTVVGMLIREAMRAGAPPFSEKRGHAGERRERLDRPSRGRSCPLLGSDRQRSSLAAPGRHDPASLRRLFRNQ